MDKVKRFFKRLKIKIPILVRRQESGFVLENDRYAVFASCFPTTLLYIAIKIVAMTPTPKMTNQTVSGVLDCFA